MDGPANLKNPRRRLPDLRLPPLRDGDSVPLRSPDRSSAVILLLHDLRCDECRRHLQALARVGTEIGEWEGRVLVVLPAPTDSAVVADVSPFPVLLDPEGRVSGALRLEIPATVVADQWGEVHASEAAGPAHRFIAPEEVISWIRFLAIRCPECEGEVF